MSRSRTSSEPGPRGVPIVISGPAGAGKTVVAAAVAEWASDLSLSVSATSRPCRPGEEEGIDYYFLSRDAFEERIERGDILEYTEHLGNYYGTLRESVEQSLDDGRDILLTLDVRGGYSIRRAFSESLLIFLVPPSMEVLEERLRGRGRDPEDDIQRRLRAAAGELECARDYDYVIVNQDLEVTVQNVLTVIRADRFRTRRILPALVKSGTLPAHILPDAPTQ